MRKRSYGYLAGMIDGDGGVYVEHSHVGLCPTYQAHVCVANCCRPLMQWLRHHFGGCVVPTSKVGDIPNFGSCVKKLYRNQTDNWQWRLTGNIAIQNVLTEIIPYLSLNYLRALPTRDLTLLHRKYRVSSQRHDCYVRATIPQEFVTPIKTSRDYLAGLIDAEGSFSLVSAKTAPSFRPLVRISNDNKQLLDWVRETTGLGEVYEGVEQGRLRYTWYFKTTEEKTAEKFILSVLPYLIVKREQAQILLNLLRTPVSERTLDTCTAIRQRIISLNKVGSVETQTSTALEDAKIESELCGDVQNDVVETAI